MLLEKSRHNLQSSAIALMVILGFKILLVKTIYAGFEVLRVEQF